MQTTKKRERVLNDFYPTPAPVTRLLTRNTNLSGTIFEPCAGHNAITDVLQQEPRVTRVLSSDLLWPLPKGHIPGGHSTNDATDPLFWLEWIGRGPIDYTVTNPPFSVAEDIPPLAYDASEKGVAFLLRLSYLEPCNGRYSWLVQHADQLRKVIIINPRVAFRTDTKGTDSVTCAWFVWEKTFSWKKLGLECPFIFGRWAK